MFSIGRSENVYFTYQGVQRRMVLVVNFKNKKKMTSKTILHYTPCLSSNTLIYCFSLRQVVQFANGQIALIEQQENIDPQAVQHLVFEQVPPQQMVQAVEEATQAQIETKPLPVPVKQELIQPPVGKVSDLGPVVQNIVSLTASLRCQFVKYICRLHYQILCCFC